MELRNQYIAHAGVNTYETIKLFAVLNPLKDTKEILTVSNFFTKTFCPNNTTVEQYLNLVENIINQVAMEEDKAVNTLLKHLSELNINDIYQNVTHPPNQHFTELEKKKELSKYYANVGTLFCLEKRDFKAGINYFNKAIELNPEDEGIYINRSNAYLAINNVEKAKSDLVKALKINPESKLAKNNYSNILNIEIYKKNITT